MWGVKSLSHWLTWQAGISSSPCPGGGAVGRSPRHPPGGDVGVRRRGVVGRSGRRSPPRRRPTSTSTSPSSPRWRRSPSCGCWCAPPAPPHHDHPPAPDDEPAESLSGWFDDDGRYHLRGEFDPDHGRIIESALSRGPRRPVPGRPDQRHLGRGDGRDGPPLDGRGTDRGGRNGSGPTGSSTRPTRSRPAGATGSPSPSGCATCCCATARCHRCSPTAPCRSASDAPNTRCPTAPAGWCCNATRSAGSRGAHKPAGCTSITSSTTNTAARPTPATWPACARPATGCTTRACSASPATPTTPTGSPSPTPKAG